MSLSVYQIVTDQIIDALNRGVAPWKRPWDAGVPKNLMSQKAYRGVNTLLLGMAGYASPYWLTYRQAQEVGGHVRKGEKGSMVTFWKLLDHKDEETGKKTKLPLLRYYNVFNLDQTEGIKLRRELTHPPRTVEPIAACETILSELPTSSARRVNGGGIACYVPDRDEIHVPIQTAFHTDPDFYSTLFHELVHSTGHESRLSREGIVNRSRFASHAYSKEELVAEMGAAFLAGEAGIAPATVDNSAAYLQSWVRVLKGDSRLVIQAAGAAQKAVDWIRGRGQTINSEEDVCQSTTLTGS